jgi:hypothetical protein
VRAAAVAAVTGAVDPQRCLAERQQEAIKALALDVLFKSLSQYASDNAMTEFCSVTLANVTGSGTAFPRLSSRLYLTASADSEAQAAVMDKGGLDAFVKLLRGDVTASKNAGLRGIGWLCYEAGRSNIPKVVKAAGEQVVALLGSPISSTVIWALFAARNISAGGALCRTRGGCAGLTRACRRQVRRACAHVQHHQADPGHAAVGRGGGPVSGRVCGRGRHRSYARTAPAPSGWVSDQRARAEPSEANEYAQARNCGVLDWLVKCLTSGSTMVSGAAVRTLFVLSEKGALRCGGGPRSC